MKKGRAEMKRIDDYLRKVFTRREYAMAKTTKFKTKVSCIALTMMILLSQTGVINTSAEVAADKNSTVNNDINIEEYLNSDEDKEMFENMKQLCESDDFQNYDEKINIITSFDYENNYDADVNRKLNEFNIEKKANYLLTPSNLKNTQQKLEKIE